MIPPTRIDLQYGHIEFSREAVAVIDGLSVNAFAENTLIARVTHDALGTVIVAFPPGYLSTDWTTFTLIASAAAGAGFAWARGRTEIRLRSME